MKRYKLAILIAAIMFMFTGCWDSVEVNQYAFIIGMGIDAGSSPDEIVVTYQIAMPMGGEDGEGAFRNVTVRAASLSEAEKETGARLDKRINLEHMQVLIIGQEAARRGVAQYKDYFFRCAGSRRVSGFVVAEGSAEDVFNKEMEDGEIPSFYIMGLLKNNAHVSGSIVESFTPAEISRNMLRPDYVLPYLTTAPEIAIKGAALMSNVSMAGVIDEGRCEAYKWLDSGSKAMETMVPVDTEIGRIIFSVSNVKTKTRIEKDGDRRAIRVRITGDCKVSEVIEGGNMSGVNEVRLNAQGLNEAVLAGAAAQIGDRVRLQSEQFLEYIQREVRADVLGYETFLRNYDARWWRQSGGQWREIYPDMTISVETGFKVTQIGAER